MKDRMNRRQRGFTLIEIMVVVVILGLLATIVAPNVLGSAERARTRKAEADVTQIASAVRMWLLHNPGQLPELDDLLRKDRRGEAYLDSYAEDPWGNDYIILRGERVNDFVVVSKGPDGILDTDDDIRSDAGRDRDRRRRDY
jgi:general secretion pathway protein G